MNICRAALGDSDNDVREAAAAALPKMSKEAVPLLIKALKSDEKHMRPMSLRVLASIGPEAAPAIPELRRLFRELKESWEP